MMKGKIGKMIIFMVMIISLTGQIDKKKKRSSVCFYSDCIECEYKDRTKCLLCDPSYWLLYGMCLKCTENCSVCQSLKICQKCDILYFLQKDGTCYGMGILGTVGVIILTITFFLVVCTAFFGYLKGKKVEEEEYGGPHAAFLSHKSRSTYLSQSNLPEIKEEEVEESPRSSRDKTIDLIEDISPRKITKVFVIRV